MLVAKYFNVHEIEIVFVASITIINLNVKVLLVMDSVTVVEITEGVVLMVVDIVATVVMDIVATVVMDIVAIAVLVTVVVAVITIISITESMVHRQVLRSVNFFDDDEDGMMLR